MFLQKILIIISLITISMNVKAYDCNQAATEMAGFHNMVLFGDPTDTIYAYHLPLFAGSVNGQSGHVNMHTYQGLWSVNLDSSTLSAYDQKFILKQTSTAQVPFFSFSPKSKAFKVPEMICNNKFTTQAIVAYGHIESNPNFPSPEILTNQLSTITKVDTLFAQKFSGESKNQLTYILFGTQKQYYLAHYLTDDENSFDQILAIDSIPKELENELMFSKNIIIEIPNTPTNQLAIVEENESNSSLNNKYKIPSIANSIIKINFNANNSSLNGNIKILGEVYFNSNSDLSIE